MAIAEPPAYQEVYRFLASAPSHEAILAFRPSEATQTRIRQLLLANKTSGLSPDEQAVGGNVSHSSLINWRV